MDFGGLKPIKQWLEETFDHKLLVAKDDPMRGQIQELDGFKRSGSFMGTDLAYKIADVQVVEATGCEAFALMVYDQVKAWLGKSNVKIEEVEIREHAGNSAIVRRRSR
jgi:6-pyruvoyltetrahydropterin/6-carboxytetrahydropterin synthase